MPAKLSTIQFIEKSLSIHGDRYGYSRTKYTNSKDKVIIICSIHGDFKQIPNSHLMGKGCLSCSGKMKMTSETFVKNSIAVHGSRYGYKQVSYVNNSTNVRIFCKKHGEFKQMPQHHLRGSGCPICGVEINTIHRTKLVDDFITDAVKIHGDKYDYSSVDYETSKKKVRILCRKHGYFLQAPTNHIKGEGCMICGNERLGSERRKPLEKFITDAVKIHGDKYDYSEVIYKSAKKKVRISCGVHGYFKQSPHDHLKGRGCTGCAISGFKHDLPGLLYYVKFESATVSPIYKIGITNFLDAEKRIKTMGMVDSFSATVLKEVYFHKGSEAYELEQLLHKEYSAHRYYGDAILQNGNTELFTKDVLGYDTRQK